MICTKLLQLRVSIFCLAYTEYVQRLYHAMPPSATQFSHEVITVGVSVHDAGRYKGIVLCGAWGAHHGVKSCLTMLA